MKKSQFILKAKMYDVEKMVREGRLNTGHDDRKELYINSKTFDIYGCQCLNEEEYSAFYIDAERELVLELGVFSTEDEAYEELYKVMKEKNK